MHYLVQVNALKHLTAAPHFWEPIAAYCGITLVFATYEGENCCMYVVPQTKHVEQLITRHLECLGTTDLMYCLSRQQYCIQHEDNYKVAFDKRSFPLFHTK